MPPILLAPDIQSTYEPVWFMTSSWLPRVYATRDIDIPYVTPGIGFDVGDSDVGGDDVVGGGAGPAWRQAFRGILNTPVVTRRIGDPAWPMVEVQDVTVVLANDNGELTGRWAGAPFTLSAYDAGSGFLLETWSGLIFHASEDRGEITITGKNLDLAMLAAEIPKGTITTAEFPLASPDAIGQTPPWQFGNVVNLPLHNVRDDQIASQFDYLLCRDTAAALMGLRRVPNGGTPGDDLPASFEMTYDELEPYPGMDAFSNLGFEDFDAGPTSAPDDWTLVGAGATVAKNITAGQFEEGSASVSLTRAGTNCHLAKDLITETPTLPLSYWQGREITATVRCRSSVINTVFIRIVDSAGSTNGNLHTGTGLFELSSATRTIDAATTALTVECRIVTTNQTAQFDNVQIYIHARSFAECLREDLYEGYTAIRTFFRQDDSSGSLFQLVADVHGLQPERNPARAIRTLASSEHGLEKAVNATSFAAAEIDACFTYDDAVRLDGPQWYLNFRESLVGDFDMRPISDIARDRSGYERHAAFTYPGVSTVTYATPGPSGDANDPYVNLFDGGYFTIPYDVRADFDSADGCTLECWYYIDDPTAATTGGASVCLIEKRIGTVALTGRTLEHVGASLSFSVRANGGAFFSVSFTLANGTHTERWMHICATAAGGVLNLYIDGALVAADVYTGDLDVGAGDTDVGHYGTGAGPTLTDAWIARPAGYSTALSVARIVAHAAAIVLDIEPSSVSNYDALIHAKSPTFYYKMTDTAGFMLDDTGAHSGTDVGSPAFLTTGPLSAERGPVNIAGAVRFVNNVAQYGVETGMTLNDAAATIVGFYSPALLRAKAGLVEKCIGTGAAAARDTQWGIRQQAAGIRLTLIHAGGTLTLNIPLLAEDVGRYGLYGFTWSGGTASAYKNGVLVATDAYTAPVASGVGDFLTGVNGTSGGVRTRPAQGDLGRWSYHPSAFTAEDFADLWIAATWYNGGLCVDAALREPRAARAWLEQICVFRGIRLGVDSDGAISCLVDASAPTTIRLEARDGPGDGVRTIKAIGNSAWPSLDETTSDVVVKGRYDLLSRAPLVERRRTVNASKGAPKVFELETARELPTLDRIAAYLAARILAGEKTVDVTMGQAARSLMEAELVQVTDAILGYSEVMMEAREVRKSIPEHAASLVGWTETIYDWDATAFPSGSTSG